LANHAQRTRPFRGMLGRTHDQVNEAGRLSRRLAGLNEIFTSA
jgi:hypothetical protein